MITSRQVTFKAIALTVFCLTLLIPFHAAHAQVGLVSHWTAEGNATDVVGNNNGTLQGNAAFAPGIAGQAFSLDGVNGYIEVPDSPSLSITGPLTLEARIKINTNTVQQAIIEKYDVPGLNGYLLRIVGGKVAAAVCDPTLQGALHGVTGATTVSTGVWHHVAAVYDGTSIKVYLDGILDGSGVANFIPTDGAASLKIGARGDDANTRLYGLIDEVKIYNQALSGLEVQALSGHSRWRADGNALDSIGTNHGTLLNGTAFTGGVNGEAFNFDGIDDRVSVPNSASLNVGTGDFTVSFFAKFNNLANNGNGLVHKDTYGNEGGYRGWLFNICDNCAGSPGIGIETRNLGQGIDNNARYPTSNFQVGIWYHIAAVRQSNVLYLYIDGVLRATVAESSPTDLSNAADLEFGSLSSGSRQNLHGALDEINFFDRALSASEIQTLASVQGPTYDSRSAFTNALCATATTKTIDFQRNDDSTPLTNPGADTYFENLLLSGTTFHQVRSYYNSFIYNFPTAPIRVYLPPNTFAFGTDLAAFYSTPGTYTITLSSGQTYQVASNGAHWTSSVFNFFGVISSTPIEWVSFSYNNDYLIIDNFTVGTGCDSTPPLITPTITGTIGNDGWYTGDVEVSWSVSDPQSNVSNSTGCDTSSVTADTAGSTFTCTATSGGGTATQAVTIKRDATAPSISCASADGAWHAMDASIACTGSDNISQLANSSDTSFSLMTSVGSGTETTNAATGNRMVCDKAGNCAMAGPISGNKIDKRAPSITITNPTSAVYLLNQSVAASFSCQDGGSGVATCNGAVPTSANIDTASVGSKTFTVSASDNVGNEASPQSVSYTVGYGISVLYDQTKAAKSGSTIPVKLLLVDAFGHNVSSAATVVHAVTLVQISTSASEVIDDAGSSNPDLNFRFDWSLAAGGGYIFNLKTTGLSTGTYRLGFSVDTNPSIHTVQFAVRQ